MTSKTGDNDPQEGAPMTPARRPGPLAGRLGTARTGAVLGRGLDALLGNLGRTPRQHETPSEVTPEPMSDEEANHRTYQTQTRRALLSRLQTAPAAAGPATSAPAPATPARSDLGRGYVHLMQAGQPAVAAGLPAAGGESDENRVILVAVERMEPSPYHGESRYDLERLRRLAQSVHELGVWQPLVVMPATVPSPDGEPNYWIISGEQRWQAAQMVGLREVPVLVRHVMPRAGLQMSLADEAHQERLSPMARCRLYGVLTGDMGMTIEDITERVGVDVRTVINCLIVLEADDFLQESFDHGDIDEEIVAMIMRVASADSRRELLRYALRYRWDANRLEKALQSRGVGQ